MAAAVPDWYSSLPDAGSGTASPAVNGNSAPDWYNSMPDAKVQTAAPPDTPPLTTSEKVADVGKSAAYSIPQGLASTFSGAGAFDLGQGIMNQTAKGGAEFRQYMSQWPELAKATVGMPVPSDASLIAGIPASKPLNASQHLFNALGIGYQPKTGLGQGVNTVGQIMSGGLGMGGAEAIELGGAKAAAKTAENAPSLASKVWSGTKSAIPSSAGAAAGGLGGQAIGGTVGATIGGIAGAVSGAKTQSWTAARAPVEIAPGVFVRADQATAAGQNILGQASNPDYVKQQMGLSGQPEAQPSVSGSTPTLAETMVNPSQEGNMGDTGISNWQRNIAQQSQNKGMFLERQQANTTAENASMAQNGGQGNPQSVTDLFNQQRSALADTTAQKANAALVASKVNALGGEEAPNLRENLEDALEAHNKAESAIWNPVKEQYGSAPVPITDVAAAVENARGMTNEKGGIDLEPSEAALYNRIDNWGETEPFSTFMDMQSSVGKVERQIRSDPAADQRALIRLGQVKRALGGSLDNASENLAALDSQNAAAKGTPTEQTLYSKVQADAEAFLAKNKQQTGTWSYSEGDTSGLEPGQQKVLPSEPGTKVPQAGGSAGAAGDQSVSETGQPVDYAAAKAQYAAAKAKTLEQKQLFTQGTVGQTMAPGRNGQQYRMSDGRVNPTLLKPGPDTAANVQQYLTAMEKSGQDIGQTVSDLHDAVINSMRSKQNGIFTDNGVNGAKLQGWLNKNSATVDAIPGLREKLSDVQKAQQFHDDSLARQTAQVDAFDKSQAGKFIGQDPSTAVVKLMAGKDPAARLAKLNDLMNSIPENEIEARNGLKKAINDYLIRNVRGSIAGDTTNVDIASAPKFRRFIADNQKFLEAVYGKEGVSNFQAVVDRMRQKAIVDQGSRTAGQSNTAEDILASGKLNAKPKSIMDHLTDLGLIGGMAHSPHLALPALVTKGLWQKFVGGAKAANAATIESLQTAAALHPSVGRILVQQADKPTPIIMKKLTNALYGLVPAVSGNTARKGNNQ